VVPPDKPLRRLPVARAVWMPKPDLATSATAWIYAGGAHHTGFSQAVTIEMLEDFASMAELEIVVIDADTEVRRFKRELEWNEVAYGLKHGFVA